MHIYLSPCTCKEPRFIIKSYKRQSYRSPLSGDLQFRVMFYNASGLFETSKHYHYEKEHKAFYYLGVYVKSHKAMLALLVQGLKGYYEVMPLEEV